MYIKTLTVYEAMKGCMAENIFPPQIACQANIFLCIQLKMSLEQVRMELFISRQMEEKQSKG
jgi:hypothetical protein